MIAKRIFDLTLALPGLVLLSPFLAVIAIWIKFDSPGPAFFRQARLGRRAEIFYIHKFRTMHLQAEGNGLPLTVGKDPRITRFGAVLRRYKLDELPQLIDVVVGDMSLVGPRPEVPRYLQYYPEKSRKTIFSLPPGITDYASLEYRDESALLGKSDDPEREYVERILPEKIKHYEAYALHRSLWLDVKIIFRTISILFHDLFSTK